MLIIKGVDIADTPKGIVTKENIDDYQRCRLREGCILMRNRDILKRTLFSSRARTNVNGTGTVENFVWEQHLQICNNRWSCTQEYHTRLQQYE